MVRDRRVPARSTGVGRIQRRRGGAVERAIVGAREGDLRGVEGEHRVGGAVLRGGGVVGAGRATDEGREGERDHVRLGHRARTLDRGVPEINNSWKR